MLHHRDNSTMAHYLAFENNQFAPVSVAGVMPIGKNPVSRQWFARQAETVNTSGGRRTGSTGGYWLHYICPGPVGIPVVDCLVSPVDRCLVSYVKSSMLSSKSSSKLGSSVASPLCWRKNYQRKQREDLRGSKVNIRHVRSSRPIAMCSIPLPWPRHRRADLQHLMYWRT